MTLKKKIGISALAILLAGLVTGGAIGIANYMKSDTTASEYETVESETSAQNLSVNTGKSNGLKLTATTLTSSDTTPTYTTGDYTLTVTYNSNATSPSFTWTSSDTASITLTPSSDTYSCTVKCNSAFSNQITITCTADDNADAYATCTVDYYKRVSSVTANFITYDGTYFSLNSTSTATWRPNIADATDTSGHYTYMCDLDTSYGTGTMTETYTLSSVKVTNSATSSYESFVVGSVDYGNTTCLARSNTTAALIYLATGYTYYYGDDAYNTYNYLYWNYTLGETALTFTITFTGDTTGITYSYDCNLMINPADIYTTVSSASLNNTSIAY